MRPGSAQHTWLVKDLAGVDRERTPFVVFGFHRCCYTCTCSCICIYPQFLPVFSLEQAADSRR